MRSHQRRKRERGTPMTDVQPEDVEAFDELKGDVEYSTFEDFECGCRVSVVKDDSQGNDYPGAPSILFDYERCPVHSRDSTDAGPIAAWIEAYSIAHPMKTAIVKTFTETEAKKLGLVKKVPIGCGRGNHDYVLVAGKNYAKCSKCVSTRTVGSSKK